MAEQISVVATPPSDQAGGGAPREIAPVSDPTVFKVLPDGTVLYKTYQQAENAARHLNSRNNNKESGKSLTQTKYGDSHLAKNGHSAPYTLGNLVEFQLTGLIVVIAVLGGLYVVCTAVGRLIQALERNKSTVPEKFQAATSSVTASQATPVKAAGIHPGLTDEQLVVILSVAASEALGTPVHIDKFRPMKAKDWNWAAKGRIDLHSHQLK